MPLSLFVFLAVVQITTMVERVAVWVQRTDLSALGDRSLTLANDLLHRVPFVDVTVTPESLQDSMTTVAQEVGKWLLGILQGAAGGAFGAITSAILFLYVFLSLLTNRDKVLLLIRRLNPLGEEITDLYMSKMGAMVKGTVMGQFVIAVCQGVAGPRRSTSPDSTRVSSFSRCCCPRCRSSRSAAASSRFRSASE